MRMKDKRREARDNKGWAELTMDKWVRDRLRTALK